MSLESRFICRLSSYSYANEIVDSLHRPLILINVNFLRIIFTPLGSTQFSSSSLAFSCVVSFLDFLAEKIYIQKKSRVKSHFSVFNCLLHLFAAVVVLSLRPSTRWSLLSHSTIQPTTTATSMTVKWNEIINIFSRSSSYFFFSYENERENLHIYELEHH